jgi:RNA 2',3'-cyclic 3'-phosphodiesterase
MSFRAFISVDLARQKEIEDYIIELKQADPTLKVVDPGQIHVTLKFLGETDEALVPRIVEAMTKAAEGINPFDLRFKGSDAFPSKNRIRVIWVGMSDGLPMGLMATRLDESISALGFEREKRPFAPHLTVARTKVETPGPVVRQLIENHRDADLGSQHIDAIRLKKSVLTRCGPEYTTVEEVRLS